MNTLVETLRTAVSADFDGDGTGHDLSHLDRVFGLAEGLRQHEGGDALVLGAACYVHDYHRVLERRTDFTVRVSREAVEEQIAAVLDRVTFPVELVPSVCECVAFTDRYSFAGHELAAPSIEARILRDADNLDALGAIGIARAFMFGGVLGEPIWVEGVDPSDTYEAGTTTSVVHHFHEKLLRVRDDMLTESGRRLANERHDFMVAFLEELMREWELSGRIHEALPDSR